MTASDRTRMSASFGRYTIGSTTDGLRTDDDGGIAILTQTAAPADTSSWLPAPNRPFNLTLRLHGAATSFLGG